MSGPEPTPSRQTTLRAAHAVTAKAEAVYELAHWLAHRVGEGAGVTLDKESGEFEGYDHVDGNLDRMLILLAAVADSLMAIKRDVVGPTDEAP